MDVEKPIDLGMLAEALLFYQSVNVICNRSTLKQLIIECGYETLLEFITAGYLKLTFLENNTGILTKNTNTPNEYHEAILYEAPVLKLQSAAPKLLQELTGKSGKGRRMANQLTKLVGTIKLATSLTTDIIEDFSDPQYICDSAIHLLKRLAPEYRHPGDIIFRPSRDGSCFRVETNIDFESVNKSYHRRVPPSHSSLSTSYLLSILSNIRKDLYLSSRYSSEITTDDVNSEILQIKFKELIQKRIQSGEDISAFQDFTLNDAKAIRESINANARSFSDLLKLLHRAEKFKGWLKGKEADIDLLKEYYREVTSSSWVDSLPSKTSRWLLFTLAGIGIDALGAGGLGTAFGVAISAADALILDNLIKGWKPNQFIEGPLKKFVS